MRKLAFDPFWQRRAKPADWGVIKTLLLQIKSISTIMHNSTMTKNTINSDQEQVVRGMLQAAVLAMLVTEPHYGAKLLLALQDTPFASRAGTLYPLLNRMLKAGLIEAKWEVSTSSPPKKYYSISPIGREKLVNYQLLMKKINSVIGGGK